MTNLISENEFFDAQRDLFQHFEIVAFDAKKAGRMWCLDTKKRYREHDRAIFLHHLASNYSDELNALGIETDFSFQEMRRIYEGVSSIDLGKIDYNIDHVMPINIGGGNDIANLSAIPKTLHDLKNNFERTANLLKFRPNQFVTLAPKGFSEGSHKPILVA